MKSEDESIVERGLGLLDAQYGMLREVAQETVESLGEEAIAYWVDAYNTCIDIESAMTRSVPQENLARSLLPLRLVELYKEMSWLLFLFLAGNYHMLARELRFTWEAVSQAYHMDTAHPDMEVPDRIVSLDEREHWGWRVIDTALPAVLPWCRNQLRAQYRRLYHHLSEMVHPSRVEMDLKLLEGEGALLITDTFVESIAFDILDMARRVFDVVWCTAFAEYPQLSQVLDRKPYLVEHLESFCPQTYGWLQRLRDGSASK